MNTLNTNEAPPVEVVAYAEKLMEDVRRNGAKSDLIVALVEDEVNAQYLCDFALDVALAARDQDENEQHAAVRRMNTWLEIKALRHAESQL